MKTLTANVRTEKSKKECSPINVLMVAWGGGYGTRYYADQELDSPVHAKGWVTDWGSISSSVAEDASAAISDTTITMMDPEGELYKAAHAYGLEQKRATVFQIFAGQTAQDFVSLLSGVISSPIQWEESDASLRFDITEMSTRFKKLVGNFAKSDTFQYMDESQDGNVIPIVYGHVTRSKCIHARCGAQTETARYIDNNLHTAKLYVVDAKKFEQNTVMELQVGNELIRGSFDGCTFNILQRACSLGSHMTTSESPSPWTLISNSLTGNVYDYIGYWISGYIPMYSGVLQYRPIVAYDPLTNKLTINALQYPWKPPSGYPFDVCSPLESHDAGSTVEANLPSFVYIANDQPSKAVHALYCWGVKHQAQTGQYWYGDVTMTKEVEGWVAIPPDTYEVNLNDTTTFPSLGRAITTITFRHNPVNLFGMSFKSNEIYADIEGCETNRDGTGSLIENPSFVIKDILERFLGMTDADYDLPAFLSAADSLAHLRFAFALTQRTDGIELVKNLAFQSCSSLLWQGDKLCLLPLTNRTGNPVITISEKQIVAGSFTRSSKPYTDLTTKVVATYIEDYDQKKVEATNRAAVNTYGELEKQIDLWAYGNRHYAEYVAAFYLNRWRFPKEQVSFQTFLDTFELDVLDWVYMDFSTFFRIPSKGQIMNIAHTPGKGNQNQIDTITYSVDLSVFSVCAQQCELSCEKGGCESVCEVVCETFCETTCESYRCENNCETVCELTCVADCEVTCTNACQVTCQMACQNYCQGSGETGCSESCEGSCEDTCQGTCQSPCESGCQDSCEITCQQSCQNSCVGVCESQCQSDCQTACQSACEGCETSCTTVCQSDCQKDCQLHCTAVEETL